MEWLDMETTVISSKQFPWILIFEITDADQNCNASCKVVAIA